MHTRYLWKIFWFWNIKNNLDNYKTHVNYDKSQIQCYLVIKNHYYLEYIVSWKHLWCNNKWKKGKMKNIQLGNKINELEKMLGEDMSNVSYCVTQSIIWKWKVFIALQSLGPLCSVSYEEHKISWSQSRPNCFF